MQATDKIAQHPGLTNITGEPIEGNKKQQQLPEVDDEVITIDIPTLQEQNAVFTTFPTADTEDITIEVLKYVSQTSYLLIQTEIYTIKITNHTTNTVAEETRTNNDFGWLSETIGTNYPGIGLPVHHIAVRYDAAQERILTVELFLRFLLNHEILRHCPEIKFFFKDSISYLQFKKLQELQKADMKKPGRINISRLQTLFKSIWSLSEAPETNDKLQLGELKEQEGQIEETRDILKQILLFQTRSCDLKAEVIKNETTILTTQNDCEELKDQLDELRKSIGEGHEHSKKLIVSEYLHSGVFMQLVYLNLERYLGLFSIIHSMEHQIQILKNNREFGEMYQSQKYLQLLKNNMKRDIRGWLDINNKILNQALM